MYTCSPALGIFYDLCPVGGKITNIRVLVSTHTADEKLQLVEGRYTSDISACVGLRRFTNARLLVKSEVGGQRQKRLPEMYRRQKHLSLGFAMKLEWNPIKYSKTLVCEHNSFQKHACSPKHSYIKVNVRNLWLSCDPVTLGIAYYSSARRRSFIKLKFIRDVCLSCGTRAAPSYSQSKVLLDTFGQPNDS